MIDFMGVVMVGLISMVGLILLFALFMAITSFGDTASDDLNADTESDNEHAGHTAPEVHRNVTHASSVERENTDPGGCIQDNKPTEHSK